MIGIVPIKFSSPGLIAPAFGKLLRDFMTEENCAQSAPDAIASQPAGEKGNIRDRVQTLRKKASKLSETLDRVEKSLQEAASEAKE